MERQRRQDKQVLKEAIMWEKKTKQQNYVETSSGPTLRMYMNNQESFLFPSPMPPTFCPPLKHGGVQLLRVTSPQLLLVGILLIGELTCLIIWTGRLTYEGPYYFLFLSRLFLFPTPCSIITITGDDNDCELSHLKCKVVVVWTLN